MSCYASAADVTPTPAAPATPALPDCSTHMSPDHQELAPCAVDQDPDQPIPDCGSCSSKPEPVPLPALTIPDPQPTETEHTILEPPLQVPDPSPRN